MDVYPQLSLIWCNGSAGFISPVPRNSNSLLRIEITYVWTIRSHKVKNSSCWISNIVHSWCDFVSLRKTEKQLTLNIRRLEIVCATGSSLSFFTGSSYLYWNGRCMMDVVMGWEAGDLNSHPSYPTVLSCSLTLAKFLVVHMSNEG